MNAGNKLLSLGIFAVIFAVCMDYPVGAPWLMAGILAYSAALWRWPRVWMAVVPALLPVLDFAPVTGWIFFNEFDLVVLATLGVSLLKKDDVRLKPAVPKGVNVLLPLFVLSYAVSMVVGILPLEAIDANSFSNYYSPYNSLRVAKGFLGALVLIPLLRKELFDPENLKRFFVPGWLAGLGGVVFFSLWERQLFSGLINFSNDYRITSTFSEMHTGGAYIDGYLSMTLPIVLLCFLLWKNLFSKAAGLALFSLGLYALLVTFSRICYASFVISMLPLTAGLIIGYKFNRRILILLAVLIITAAGLTIPVLKGDFIRARFSTLSQSVDIRMGHWTKAMEKMDQGLATQVFGMGLGSYPRTYSKHPDGRKPAYYKFITENNDPFLRIFPGDSLYMGQRISPEPDQGYILRIDVKSSEDNSRLTIPICEKSHLHSYNCKWKTIKLDHPKDKWAFYEVVFQELNIGQGHFYQKRPVQFALYNSSRNAVIDIDNVQLLDRERNNLIKNGDFSKGIDFWFFNADNHLPWHIKNIWVSLYFEQGIAGVISFSLLVLYTLAVLFKRIRKRDLLSLILLSSFCGFFVVGCVDSLFDSPRISMLFYLSMFIVIFSSEGVVTRRFTNQVKGNFQ